MTEIEFDKQSKCVISELKTIINLTENDIQLIAMFCTIYEDRFCTDNFKIEKGNN